MRGCTAALRSYLASHAVFYIHGVLMSTTIAITLICIEHVRFLSLELVIKNSNKKYYVMYISCILDDMYYVYITFI